MLLKWKQKLHNKKGFTLIELIVVLVILGIILAVTVPAVTSYIDDANEVKNDVKISYLNKASGAYSVHQYADNKWKQGEDLFDGVTTDKERQQILVDAGLIDELQTNIHDSDNYFVWDIDQQKWIKDGESGESPGNLPDDDKIIEDIIDGGKDCGDWKPDRYYYNDIVRGSDGNYYKCIANDPYGVLSRVGPVPTSMGRDSYWKKISIDFDNDTTYETGDIVKFNGKYYKATNFDSSKKWNAYDDVRPPYATDEQIIAKLFVEVEWKNDAFVEVT